MKQDEQSQFVADLEHSLKSPLLAAIRRSDMALQRDQPTREDLVLIRALCNQVWARLSSLRAASRMVSNEPVRPSLIRVTATDILKVLDGLVQDARALDRHDRQHRFRIIADRYPNGEVEIDLNLFEAALREVIDNAIQHSLPSSSIEIELSGHHGAGLTIRIINETPPFAPDDLKHFFELGWRSSTARLQTSQGSGFGLFFVQSIIRAQRGDISVDSSGTKITVKIELPILDEGRKQDGE